MPGLLQRGAQFGNAPAPVCSPPPPPPGGSLTSSAIWSKHRDDITFDQLQKFWSESSLQARLELLRIDKQTLFEQARKNLYCSRCNGLLLEGFSQIVLYGKSLQHEGIGMHLPCRASKTNGDCELDDVQDPSVHPWGGLATTRDGILTLLDCFINAKSLRALQNVFDSARARERERELLYPDACGGGGRGWISQGMANYGRGHGMRETCALHTARLSCDTLVDFWSALGEETRTSLLRMKEEDFIERLMFRFDSKRFCRDCRRNVIREFKELKELKRMRRELRCTSWFCVADTAFQYEVSEDTVQADWHQSFIDTVAAYHHFEWAIGTGEGKSDILDFEDVGMNGKVEVNGLELGGLSACFITLRAWKLDGRCTEFCVKAHALKGQPCVHRRLVVGDGFVTITKGESIRTFFEHAEEAEEEEDDDAVDKDGNELDGDGSRPQKHAKSPELAREFLLDAATVIFKEQVEKAFREGTARQNAHSIFVSLALKLLEERVHVACKEIITLEKQIKLLEEEEKEKREEEERRERRRTKEREKKLRRKERIKGKERERERKHIESNLLHCTSPTSLNGSSTSTHGESSPNTIDSGDSISDPGDAPSLLRSFCPDIKEEQSSNGFANSNNLKTDSLQHHCHADGELNIRDGGGSFILEQSKSTRRKLRFKKESLQDQASKWYDKHRHVTEDEGSVQYGESDVKLMASSRCINGGHRSLRERIVKTNARNCNLKFNEKFHCSNNRLRDRYDFQSCGCNQHNDYRPKDAYHISTVRSGRETKITNRSESTLDMPRPLYRTNKYNHGCYVSDNGIVSKGKLAPGAPNRDVLHTKQVWEPMGSRRKCTRSSSDPDVTLSTSVTADLSEEIEFEKAGNGCQHLDDESPEISENVSKADGLNSCGSHEVGVKSSPKSDPGSLNVQNGFVAVTKSDCYSKDDTLSTFPMSSTCDPIMSSSSSDNCSSCLSEGDSSISSSSAQNAESSSTSDSEDASQQSEARDTTTCNGTVFHSLPEDTSDSKTDGVGSFGRDTAAFPLAGCLGANLPKEGSLKAAYSSDNGRFGFEVAPPHQQHLLPMHNQSMHMPVFPSPAMGYHTQNAVSWPAAPATGLVPFPQPNRYVFPPSPLGYGGLPANRSEFGLRYNNLQPVAAPMFSVHHQSMYQASNRVYVPSSKDQIKNFGFCRAQHANGGAELPNGHSPEGPSPNRRLPTKPTSTVEQDDTVGNGGRSCDDSQSFSLFHFGGPLAGSTGFSMSPQSQKEENAGKFVSKSPVPQADAAGLKEDTGVEYSLFAAGNGAMFQFF